MPRSRPYKLGLHERLNDPQHAAAYLNAVAGAPRDVRMLALRDVAEVHKISKVALAAGVNRETLYRTLSERGNPTLATLDNILEAVGVEVYYRARVKRKRRVAKGGMAAATQKSGTLSNVDTAWFASSGLLGTVAPAFHQYETTVSSMLSKRAVNADLLGIPVGALNPHSGGIQTRINDESSMFINQSVNP